MANPAERLLHLVRPLTGAGAVANAVKVSREHERLTRCDLIIFERTGQLSEGLIRRAQHDPDRLKDMDAPPGLHEAIDRALLARSRMSHPSNRLP